MRADLQSQCETTQNTEHGTGATLLGYSKLYGQLPGGQAEYLRVPHADYGAVKVPKDRPDDRYLFLSDVLPTAWQAVEYADVPDDGTLLVVGAGPIGDMAARIALHRGHRVIVADLVGERLQPGRGARRRGHRHRPARRAGLGEVVRSRTAGRGADSVIDAVGMEAHGSVRVKLAQRFVGMLPDAVAEPLAMKASTDRLTALLSAVDAVRRGGTISISGVYGGAADPLPLMQLFDKQVQIRMGQANVRAWTDDILDLLDQDEDVLGRRVLRHPPPRAGGGAGRLRDLPEEGGRGGQDRLPTLIGYYVHHGGRDMASCHAVAHVLGERHGLFVAARACWLARSLDRAGAGRREPRG